MHYISVHKCACCKTILLSFFLSFFHFSFASFFHFYHSVPFLLLLPLSLPRPHPIFICFLDYYLYNINNIYNNTFNLCMQHSTIINDVLSLASSRLAAEINKSEQKNKNNNM